MGCLYSIPIFQCLKPTFMSKGFHISSSVIFIFPKVCVFLFVLCKVMRRVSRSMEEKKFFVSLKEYCDGCAFVVACMLWENELWVVSEWLSTLRRAIVLCLIVTKEGGNVLASLRALRTHYKPLRTHQRQYKSAYLELEQQTFRRLNQYFPWYVNNEPLYTPKLE